MPAKQCPNCGGENALDARQCVDCEGALPDSVELTRPPGETEPEARSVVLATFHSKMNAQVAAKHLEDAGVLTVVAADDCGGLYPVLTPAHGIRVLVKASDLPRAREALRDMDEQFGIKSEGVGGDTGAATDTPGYRRKSSPVWGQLGIFVAGAVFAALAYSAMTYRRSEYTGTTSEDRNGDGRADIWWVYQKGQIVQSSEDLNNDYRPDYWRYYRKGIVQSSEFDTDFDGKVDVWSDYEHDLLTRRREDLDHDGRADSETRYVAELPVTTDFAISNKLGYWRRDIYTNGIVRETHLDRDRDGQIDEKILFDRFGTFIRVEPMK